MVFGGHAVFSYLFFSGIGFASSPLYSLIALSSGALPLPFFLFSPFFFPLLLDLLSEYKRRFEVESTPHASPPWNCFKAMPPRKPIPLDARFYVLTLSWCTTTITLSLYCLGSFFCPWHHPILPFLNCAAATFKKTSPFEYESASFLMSLFFVLLLFEPPPQKLNPTSFRPHRKTSYFFLNSPQPPSTSISSSVPTAWPSFVHATTFSPYVLSSPPWQRPVTLQGCLSGQLKLLYGMPGIFPSTPFPPWNFSHCWVPFLCDLPTPPSL